MERAERASREEWAKRVQRWKDSGLTGPEFAAETGINPHTLSWWSSALARPRERSSRSKARKPHGATAVSPMTFIEVTTPISAEPIEVVLPSGVRIRIPSSFDERTLGRVLGVLEQRL